MTILSAEQTNDMAKGMGDMNESRKRENGFINFHNFSKFKETRMGKETEIQVVNFHSNDSFFISFETSHK